MFKLQANMDPRHRDKVAFVRVVSGKFERGMKVTNARTKKAVALSRPSQLFGQDKTVLDEGFAGHPRSNNSSNRSHSAQSRCWILPRGNNPKACRLPQRWNPRLVLRTPAEAQGQRHRQRLPRYLPHSPPKQAVRASGTTQAV